MKWYSDLSLSLFLSPHSAYCLCRPLLQTVFVHFACNPLDFPFYSCPREEQEEEEQEQEQEAF